MPDCPRIWRKAIDQAGSMKKDTNEKEKSRSENQSIDISIVRFSVLPSKSHSLQVRQDVVSALGQGRETAEASRDSMAVFLGRLRKKREREREFFSSFSQLLFVVSALPGMLNFSFRLFFRFLFSARQRPPLPPLKMRRAASRLAALAVRQQRLISNTLASSSSSSNTTAGTATGCSCLMHRGGATTLVSSTSSTTFRHRFLHSTAALGSDAGPRSNLSSLRASLAAAADDEEEGDTGIAVASVSDEDDDGGSLSLLLPSSPPPPPPPPSSTQPPPPPSRQAREPDFTQLAALAASLAVRAVPGRVDDVVGVDEETVALKLRVRPLAEVVAAISHLPQIAFAPRAPPRPRPRTSSRPPGSGSAGSPARRGPASGPSRRGLPGGRFRLRRRG